MGKHVDSNQVHRAAVASMGAFGRVKIVAGASDTYEGEGVSVLPITDDFTYGADCQAHAGEAPAEDEAKAQDIADLWPVKKVVAKTGSAYVYLGK